MGELATVETEVPAILTKMASRFSIDPSRMVATLKATAFRGEVSDEQMAALLIVADQYGLNPWTREIYAFPDKQNGIVPVVGVDGWIRITNSHPQFDGMEFRESEEVLHLDGAKPCPAWIECTIYRKDRQRATVVRSPFHGKSREGGGYTVNGPWQSHTKRMLRHKAVIQAARLVFGFAGIFDPDEADGIIEKDITPIVDLASRRAPIDMDLPAFDEREWTAKFAAQRSIDAVKALRPVCKKAAVAAKQAAAWKRILTFSQQVEKLLAAGSDRDAINEAWDLIRTLDLAEDIKQMLCDVAEELANPAIEGEVVREASA
jgi:phage recombination protein Bet